ncbi:GNAT family N-acetyltransferase [Actinoplanes oblitus]|uniref:GNAT family N-acetyltransferase n=1 Tax=Actinoplanes oblitus TaxID=3040509 RepID=A0ABY8W935_9ACTN|nr:GNAT family N-acetyltransferase [Actinoplanes oblitus]WIM92953.1 GNAT family N-acetyltransferase [Actinoplanes oblitus]
MSTGPVDALTADGGIVSIRPVTPRDRRAVAGLYARAAPENLRLRFFTWPTAATLATEADRLCRPQSPQFLAMAAYQGAELVGVASCDRRGEEPRGEFAVFVGDRHHGRGIGTLLLEHLAARARRHGITELVGEVLSSNADMMKVARDLGPDGRSRLDHGIVDVTLDTGGAAAREAVDRRDRIAEQASLRAVFAPATVAVVGAGRRPGGAGHEAFRALRDYGFTGRLYAVHPRGAPIGATYAYRTLADLPEPVELLVIAVPADRICGVLRDGAAAGARAAIILTPLGPDPDGRRRAELLRQARSHGVRLVGPGSLGVLSTRPETRLNAGLFPIMPPAGRLAVAVESGAAALAVIDHAARTGCGISQLVSLGDKTDVGGNDLIAYWHDDPATAAVALHLASFGNPARFARTVRELARHKPVLAVRDSRAPAGVDEMFARAGVVRTENLGDLMDAARMLTGQPLPAGHRLAVVGDAGGLVAAAHATTIHVGADASPAAYAATADAVARDGDADLVLLVVTGTRVNPAGKTLAALGPVVDRYPRLPVAAVVLGAEDVPARLGRRGVPIYDLPERAARALAHAAGYAAWLRATPADPPGTDPEPGPRALRGPASP